MPAAHEYVRKDDAQRLALAYYTFRKAQDSTAPGRDEMIYTWGANLAQAQDETGLELVDREALALALRAAYQRMHASGRAA